MIIGIVASSSFTPPPDNIDPDFADVLLLIDASRKTDDSDPDWSDVLLLIDASKRP